MFVVRLGRFCRVIDAFLWMVLDCGVVFIPARYIGSGNGRFDVLSFLGYDG